MTFLLAKESCYSDRLSDQLTCILAEIQLFPTSSNIAKTVCMNLNPSLWFGCQVHTSNRFVVSKIRVQSIIIIISALGSIWLILVLHPLRNKLYLIC